MLLRLEFNRYCEFIGRASAIVAFVSMTSLILAATAVDSGTSRRELRSNPQCPLFPQKGHLQCTSVCPLCANSGHRVVRSDT